jgi:hypothetical protein
MKRLHPAQRQPAQIVAMFALGLLGFLAMVSVILDGGTLYLQRRTAQNAADAAALAGARALQQATVQTTSAIGEAVCTYLRSNAFGVTPTATAYFVGVSGTNNLGPIAWGSTCAASPAGWIPIGASGVHVDVTVGPYNTYLAGIVGVRQLKAQASATSQVGVLGIPNPDLAPLAGCGPDMLVNGGSPTPFRNIFNPDNLTINPAYYAPPPAPPFDVVLQGSQMSQNEDASCPKWNTNSSAWKGKIDTSGITGPLTPPMQIPVDTGNGTVDTLISDACLAIYGPGHDPVNSSAGDDVCFLLIPIATPPNPADNANIVTLACFSLYDGGNGVNKWRGILHPPTDCTYGVYPPIWTFGNTNSETQVMLTN